MRYSRRSHHNPSIMFKDGVTDIKKRAIEIAGIIKPVPERRVTRTTLTKWSNRARSSPVGAEYRDKNTVINQDGEPCIGL